MIATNWGVYELGMRDPQFIEAGDTRELQIRARSRRHLGELRYRYPVLAEIVFLGNGVADFQYRIYATREVLADIFGGLVYEIDYIRFKEGALKDRKLHNVLSQMWSVLLNAYPEGSSYFQPPAAKKRKEWWEED